MKKILLLMIFLYVSITGAQPQSGPPCAKSDFITGITFAPVSTIIRQAAGGDNWPVTWGDDNLLYTVYGDGWGFEPKVADKLSIGYAKVLGMPPYHFGLNVRSTGERFGQGREGEKGCGIIMVDGVIYIWLMHADRQGAQCRLAWSDDKLKTVHFNDWVFEDFGICTFINYGQNNAGAIDDYVYTVSHDSPRPDVPADRFVLMRVHKERIVDRDAWQFYTGVDESGNPLWSSDISERGAVFEHSNACLRSSISYNTGLGRYLWWQQIPNYEENNKDLGDTRFEGGFGIYEAPEPWGPWKTVYYTPKWDVGPGELACFPAKWQSADGKTAWMVFSGDDAFSVRKVTYKKGK